MIPAPVAYAFLRVVLPAVLPRVSLATLVARLTPEASRRRRASAATASVPSPAAVARTEAQLRVVDAVLARVPALPSTCLYRALGRYGVYRRRGVDVRFVMGLDPAEARGEIVAHAWLERDGAPFAEALEAAYVKTFEYPSGGVSS